MDFNKYQEMAMSFSKLESAEDHVIYGVLNTASEAGEIAGKFAKATRDKTDIDKEAVIKEMGDVLWSLSALATGLGVDMSRVAAVNINKLAGRKQRDTIGGSGDDR